MTDIRLMGTTATGESVPVLVSPQGEVVVEASGITAQAPLIVGGTAEAPEISIQEATQSRAGAMSAADKVGLDLIAAELPQFRRVDDSYDKTEIDAALDNYYTKDDVYTIEEIYEITAAINKPILNNNEQFNLSGAPQGPFAFGGYPNTAVRLTFVFRNLKVSGSGPLILRPTILEGPETTGYKVTTSYAANGVPAVAEASTTGIKIVTGGANDQMDGCVEFLSTFMGMTMVRGTIAHSNPAAVQTIAGAYAPSIYARPIESLLLIPPEGVTFVGGEATVVAEH